MNSMKKWFVRTFCPSAETLAGLSADGIAGAVNGSKAEVREKVARIGAVAAKATDIANRLARMVEDGTVDGVETAELAKMLTPVYDGALNYAFSW